MQTLRNKLIHLAKVYGIELEYEDVKSEIHETSPEQITHVLDALGVQVGSAEQLEEAVNAERRAKWTRLAEPTIVRTISELGEPFHFQIPAADNGGVPPTPAVQLDIHYENGHVSRHRFAEGEVCFDRSERVDDTFYDRFTLPFPEDLPCGYYTFELQVNGGGQSCQQHIDVAVCPDQAWAPPELQTGGKRAGVAVAVYGLRSERNWGVGDFRDLMDLVRWATEELRADFIGINPLHAIPNRQPHNISPYYPWSRFYRNYIYLAIEEIPDFADAADARQFVATEDFQNALRGLRAAEAVQYEQAANLKRHVLHKIFDAFLARHWQEDEEKSARRRAFEDYIEEEGGMLERFAVFCALEEHFRNAAGADTWRDWPEEFQHPDTEAVRRFARENRQEVLYYKYEQWQIAEQLGELEALTRKQGMTVGIYGDLALGTDPAGADYWAYRDYLVPAATVGAPPDPLSPEGQDWAFCPPDMEAYRRDGYRLFIEEIRRNCRFVGALRIDHVMRFKRLFWILSGQSASEGVYVENNAHDLLALTNLESERNRTLVIGEDLGTVPADFRQKLQRSRVFSYRVFLFESGKDGRLYPAEHYPAESLATLTTHDMCPLAGFWTFEDLRTRRRLDLITSDIELEHQIGQRKWNRRHIIERLVESDFVHPGYLTNPEEVGEFTGELHNGVIGFLLSTGSTLAVVSIEDLLKGTTQQNVPGVTEGYLNWSTKMPMTIEQLRIDPFARGCAGMFRAWVEKTHRVTSHRASTGAVD